MTNGVQLVTGLPRLYQDDTNSVPIVKNSQDSQDNKSDCCCRNRHTSINTVPTMYLTLPIVNKKLSIHREAARWLIFVVFWLVAEGCFK